MEKQKLLKLIKERERRDREKQALVEKLTSRKRKARCSKDSKWLKRIRSASTKVNGIATSLFTQAVALASQEYVNLVLDAEVTDEALKAAKQKLDEEKARAAQPVNTLGLRQVKAANKHKEGQHELAAANKRQRTEDRESFVNEAAALKENGVASLAEAPQKQALLLAGLAQKSAVVLQESAPSELSLEDLQERVCEFAKLGGDTSAIELAKQVIAHAKGALLSGGHLKKSVQSKEGPHEPDTQALVIFGQQRTSSSEPVQKEEISDRAPLKPFVDLVRLAKKLMKLFLVTPRKLEKKYLGCRLPEGGSDGRNTAGLSVEDKLRENKLQIFLRLEILEADPPGQYKPNVAKIESPLTELKKKLTDEIVALVENVTPNLRGSDLADTALQTFLDREIKARYASKLPDALNHLYQEASLSPPFPNRFRPAPPRNGLARLHKKKKHKKDQSEKDSERPALLTLDNTDALRSQEAELKRATTARVANESQFQPPDWKRMYREKLEKAKPARQRRFGQAEETPLFGGRPRRPDKAKLARASRRLLEDMEGTEASLHPVAVGGDNGGSPWQSSEGTQNEKSELGSFLRNRIALVGGQGRSAEPEGSGNPANAADDPATSLLAGPDRVTALPETLPASNLVVPPLEEERPTSENGPLSAAGNTDLWADQQLALVGHAALDAVVTNEASLRSTVAPSLFDRLRQRGLAGAGGSERVTSLEAVMMSCPAAVNSRQAFTREGEPECEGKEEGCAATPSKGNESGEEQEINGEANEQEGVLEEKIGSLDEARQVEGRVTGASLSSEGAGKGLQESLAQEGQNVERETAGEKKGGFVREAGKPEEAEKETGTEEPSKETGAGRLLESAASAQEASLVATVPQPASEQLVAGAQAKKSGQKESITAGKSEIQTRGRRGVAAETPESAAVAVRASARKKSGEDGQGRASPNQETVAPASGSAVKRTATESGARATRAAKRKRSLDERVVKADLTGGSSEKVDLEANPAKPDLGSDHRAVAEEKAVTPQLLGLQSPGSTKEDSAEAGIMSEVEDEGTYVRKKEGARETGQLGLAGEESPREIGGSVLRSGKRRVSKEQVSSDGVAKEVSKAATPAAQLSPPSQAPENVPSIRTSERSTKGKPGARLIEMEAKNREYQTPPKAAEIERAAPLSVAGKKRVQETGLEGEKAEERNREKKERGSSEARELATEEQTEETSKEMAVPVQSITKAKKKRVSIETQGLENLAEAGKERGRIETRRSERQDEKESAEKQDEQQEPASAVLIGDAEKSGELQRATRGEEVEIDHRRRSPRSSKENAERGEDSEAEKDATEQDERRTSLRVGKEGGLRTKQKASASPSVMSEKRTTRSSPGSDSKAQEIRNDEEQAAKTRSQEDTAREERSAELQEVRGEGTESAVQRMATRSSKLDLSTPVAKRNESLNEKEQESAAKSSPDGETVPGENIEQDPDFPPVYSRKDKRASLGDPVPSVGRTDVKQLEAPTAPSVAQRLEQEFDKEKKAVRRSPRGLLAGERPYRDEAPEAVQSLPEIEPGRQESGGQRLADVTSRLVTLWRKPRGFKMWAAAAFAGVCKEAQEASDKEHVTEARGSDGREKSDEPRRSSRIQGALGKETTTPESKLQGSEKELQTPREGMSGKKRKGESGPSQSLEKSGRLERKEQERSPETRSGKQRREEASQDTAEEQKEVGEKEHGTEKKKGKKRKRLGEVSEGNVSDSPKVLTRSAEKAKVSQEDAATSPLHKHKSKRGKSSSGSKGEKQKSGQESNGKTTPQKGAVSKPVDAQGCVARPFTRSAEKERKVGDMAMA